MSEKQDFTRGYIAFVKKCTEERIEELEESRMMKALWNELRENQKHLSCRYIPIPSRLNFIRKRLESQVRYLCPYCKSTLRSYPVYDKNGSNDYDGFSHDIHNCPKCKYKFASKTEWDTE